MWYQAADRVKAVGRIAASMAGICPDLDAFVFG